jgi:transcriptional regulator with XRE-family HTH domain
MNRKLIAFMQDPTLRKSLGKRIKVLRKDKQLTQKQLAKEIGSSPGQLNKYESGLNTPPVDKLMMLAEVFQCSLDYLIVGQNIGELPISNQRLAMRFKQLDELTTNEKEVVIKMLDAMITTSRIESTLQSFRQ